MAVEALTFPDPPTLTNGNDGGQDYNLGIRFSVDEAVSCVGVRWIRTPDSVSPPPTGGTHVAAIWTNDTEIRVAFKNFTPTPATNNFDVIFDTPIMLDPAPQLYVVSIFSRDYVYRASGGVEVVSPSGAMQADQGKLASNISPLTFPASNQAAYYYVSPLIETGGTTPFTKDYTLNWRVLNSFTKDYAAQWRVLGGLTKDYALAWRVLGALQKDYGLAWRVLGGFSRDYVVQWQVLNAWQADTVLAWRVLNALQKDYALVWDVLPDTAFARTYTVLWNVRGVFNKDYILRWRVLSDTPPPALPADVVAYLEDHVVAHIRADSVTAYLK